MLITSWCWLPEKSLKGLGMLKRVLLLSLSLIFLLGMRTLAQDQSAPAPQATPAATEQKPAAPSEENQAEALQKATQNPVANLISVPLQNNNNFNSGPYNRDQDVLNIQPVIPAHLGKNWMLISRIIQPIVWQPYPDKNTGGEYGLGDMNPTFFLSPAKSGKLIWGAGPTFVIPTATNDILGQGKFSIGPSFVALAQPKHWTLARWLTTYGRSQVRAAARPSTRCSCSTSSTTT